MTFIRCWLVAVFVTLPTLAHATGCKVAVRKNVVVQAVVVQKAAVVQAVAAVAAVPVYGAYQNIYGATYQPDGLVEAFKVLLQQNQQLIQQNTQIVEQLRYQGGQPGKPQQSTLPMQPADPQQAGQQPLGALADLTPDQNAAVISATVKGTMPKGKPLPLADRLAFVDTLTSGTEADIAKAFSVSCAACHSASNAKVKGGGLVLLK